MLLRRDGLEPSTSADCVVAPGWDPPSPGSFSGLAEHLRGTGKHVLFKTSLAAEKFRNYYVDQGWAETENKPFIPVGMDAIPSALSRGT
jgi:hypothetical protein